MIRAVLDTNVGISSLLAPSGIPARLVALAEAGAIDAIVSPRLLGEVALTMRRFGDRIDAEDVTAYVRHVEGSCRLIGDPPAPPQVCRDPADDFLLALAAATDALLVTGDRDLLDLRDPPVTIVSPRALLDVLPPDLRS